VRQANRSGILVQDHFIYFQRWSQAVEMKVKDVTRCGDVQWLRALAPDARGPCSDTPAS